MARYHSIAMTTEASQSVVDWQRIDTVLLDMDGTVLDLDFDNCFWQHHMPQRYAETAGLSEDAAWARLMPIFENNRGRLNWYDLDFWGQALNLDMLALKHELAHLIRPLPGAEEFLSRVRDSGRSVWLVTNAHPGSLWLKMARTGLEARFDRIVSAHDLGYPKEDSRFWPLLTRDAPCDPARSLMVDDNLPVLETAAAFGIGQVVAITRPDTRGPLRRVEHLSAVTGLVDLLTEPLNGASEG